jgi:hypothetical protein
MGTDWPVKSRYREMAVESDAKRAWAQSFCRVGRLYE